MPFTLCHPALILPLRRHVPLAGLVIGSMMPDLPYFLITGASGNFSHSLLGILAYCVPVGALIYLLYHALLREAWIDWAPAAIGARLAPVAWLPRDAAAVAQLLAALAIGAASHIAWDAFTHANTFVVRHVDALSLPVEIGGHVLPLYNLLQHLSSLVGFLVIACYGARWFARTEPHCAGRQGASPGQRLGIATAIVAAAVLGAVVGLRFREARSTEHVLFNIVVTSMAMAALTIVALCAGWQVHRRRRGLGKH